MNINFEVALRYINLESYEKAVEHLKLAIGEETANGKEDTAIQYTCVLGELFANLGRVAEAREQFNKVLEYCRRTSSLPKQRDIALAFMDAFDGKIKTVTQPMNAPMSAKPVQNKAFIQKQMRKNKGGGKH